MDKKAALNRLHEIVKGIDQEESLSGDGWWETSEGAAFGAARLAQLEMLIADLTA